MSADELPDHEEILDTIRAWLKKHGRDPHAGLMLQDFLYGNCAHDFVVADTLACELCGTPTEGT